MPSVRQQSNKCECFKEDKEEKEPDGSSGSEEEDAMETINKCEIRYIHS